MRSAKWPWETNSPMSGTVNGKGTWVKKSNPLQGKVWEIPGWKQAEKEVKN